MSDVIVVNEVVYGVIHAEIEVIVFKDKITHIKSNNVTDQCIIYLVNGMHITCKETYEEVWKQICGLP